MVADNDIYVRLSPDGGQDFRLTDSGQPGTIYNGVPDFLYQGKESYVSPLRVVYITLIVISQSE